MPESAERAQSPGTPAKTTTASTETRTSDERTLAEVQAQLESERRQLADARAQLESEHRQEKEDEGTPIAVPKDIPKRLSQPSLLQAATAAFRQSAVPGRVETIDCSEYPCILYGRINGDEDLIERVERTKALAPYADDVLTLLSWAATDEDALNAGRPHQTRPERMLIAIAIYSQDDQARYGDDIDRRVRVRTAELWNALRPDDEE